MAQERITINHLRRQVENLNRLTGNPATELTPDRKWNIGTYRIDQAYGGYSLEQIANASGGVHDVFSRGHMPARELHGLIRAYVAGLQERPTEVTL